MNNTNETVERQAREFWTSQDEILENMQHVANAWFDRRHAGTQAALDAAQRMTQAATPAQLLLEYQTWAMGAFERLIADAVACQGCSVAIARSLAQSMGRGDIAAAMAGTQAGMVVPSAPEVAPASVPPMKAAPLRRTSGARATG
jgi:hypothetical protein